MAGRRSARQCKRVSSDPAMDGEGGEDMEVSERMAKWTDAWKATPSPY